MNTDPQFLVRDAEVQLDDLERELGIKPLPSVFELFDARFDAVRRSLDEASTCALDADLARRLEGVKSRLEDAGVVYVNYVNKPEPFDPWDESEE
jgi:hypothetical protein